MFYPIFKFDENTNAFQSVIGLMTATLRSHKSNEWLLVHFKSYMTEKCLHG